MNTIFYALLIIVPAMALLFSALMTFKKRMEGKSIGRAMRVNLATFLVLIVMVSAFTFVASATDDEVASDVQTVAVAEEAAETEEAASDSGKGLGLLAAGLVTGLAGIGGGIAVAAGAPACQNFQK